MSDRFVGYDEADEATKARAWKELKGADMIPNRQAVDKAIEDLKACNKEIYGYGNIMGVLEGFLPWSGGSTGQVYGDDCDDCIRPDAGCGGCIIHDTREGDEILIKPRR